MKSLRRILAAVLLVAGSAPLSGLVPSGLAGATGGTWTTSPTPSPSGSAPIVNDVSCVSATDCMAVGSVTPGSGSDEAFAMRWDGTTWTVVTTPEVSSGNTRLLSVSCPMASFCVAVGTFYDATSARFTWFPTHWDGTTWNVLSGPQAGTSHNFVTGVSCTGASNCVVVGYFYDVPRYKTLVQRWDGSSWAADSSPNGGSSTASNILNSVSCVGANDCMAVGYRTDGSGQPTIAIRWDGSTWSSTSPTDGAGTTNYLRDVWCNTATDCVAVGYSADDNLATRWNGTTWAAELVPNAVSGRPNRLYSISCTSPNSCVAVGRSQDGGYRGSILEFDGSSWAVRIPEVIVPGEDVELLGVSCLVSGACAAVGYVTEGQGNRSLSLGMWSVPATPPSTSPVVGPAYTG